MDDTDDWMNPPTSMTWTFETHPDGTFYLIQRKKAIPVSGNVSRIYRWEMWKMFDNREERDKELAMWRKSHPSWHLRARTIRYFNGEGRIDDPSEYMDF